MKRKIHLIFFILLVLASCKTGNSLQSSSGGPVENKAWLYYAVPAGIGDNSFIAKNKKDITDSFEQAYTPVVPKQEEIKLKPAQKVELAIAKKVLKSRLKRELRRAHSMDTIPGSEPGSAFAWVLFLLLFILCFVFIGLFIALLWLIGKLILLLLGITVTVLLAILIGLAFWIVLALIISLFINYNDPPVKKKADVKES